MKHKEERYKELIGQYVEGSITEPDKVVLMNAVKSGQADIALEDKFATEWQGLGEVEKSSNDSIGARIFKDIQRKIKTEETPKIQHPKKVSLLNIAKWAVAASVVGLIATAIIWNLFPSKTVSGFSATIPKSYLKTTNNAKETTSFILPDGSMVKMVTGATLYYPESFTASMREVYLEGDAFFEVEPQNGVGFKVYNRSLVAEVLGTSFWVRQNEKNGSDNVEVRTGKVKVSANLTDGETIANNTAMVVLPNQQVQYNVSSKQLNLTLADSLIPLRNLHYVEANATITALNFRKPTKLKTILHELEELYGVNIEVSDPNLNNCLMAGNLSTQDLLKKLEIICLSIGATYEVEGANIILNGEGCPD